MITDESEVKTALRAFYEHLTDSGVLLFEAETIRAVPPLDVWRGSSWKRHDGTKIVLSGLSSFEEGVCTSLCKYELVSGSKIIQTEIEELKVRIYDQGSLLTLLRECGFRNIRCVRAFDISKDPGNEDESVVYECRK